MIRKTLVRFLSVSGLMLVLSHTAHATQSYATQISRVGSNVYEGWSGDYIVTTAGCNELASSSNAIVQIDSNSGYPIGKIYFPNSAVCTVTGLYGYFANFPFSSLPASLSLITNYQESFYIDQGLKLIVRSPYCPVSGSFVSSTIAVLVSGRTYQGGLPIGNAKFSWYTCSVTGLYGWIEAAGYDLIIEKLGTGSGTVTSSPAGIDCGTDCSHTFNSGDMVTLTATPAIGSTFAGWGAPCFGLLTCFVEMDRARDLKVTFTNPIALESAIRTIVASYYESILGRPADAVGLEYWVSEAYRVLTLGADIREAFFAMSMAFFSSSEYISRNATNAQFITNLYGTFFGRAPDAGGLAFWLNELDALKSRSALLNSFLFSDEFRNAMTTRLGSYAPRPEVDMTIDLFRGTFGRLPDSPGFNFWLGELRKAQCLGGPAVSSKADEVAGLFFTSAEYIGRGRSDRDFIGDVYNAYMRRGPSGDAEGFNFWAAQVPAMGRDWIRSQFVPSTEFQNRVSAVIEAGCLQP